MSPNTAEPFADFAILAPVPVAHLKTGFEKAGWEDLPYLAFGSGPIKDNTSLYSLELFRSIDEERKGRPVVVLIYPSWEEETPKPPYLVEWTGLYVGHVPSRTDGLHPATPDPWKYRPPSCRTNREAGRAREEWILYWHAAGVRPLPPELQIEVTALGRKKPMRPWPIGPEVIRGIAWHSIRDFCQAPPPSTGPA